ncbi:MAG: LPS export ABC transporter permease LptG [Desulfuromonadaceae bacterium GWC2_58_13]|nr:MAG: LPS export ABC transporter permease LptG [Desulfuromonadaceae bacterium GWC2_58_13]
MTLLSRYVLKSFYRLLLLALTAFVGIFLLIDFFERIDDFLEHGARGSLYFLYLLNNFPIATFQVIPLAILLAAFGTIGGLARSNELTAIRSGGISIWRIILPLIRAAVLLTLISLAANEYLIPLNQKNINYINRVEMQGKVEIYYKSDHIWFREGNRIFNIRHSLPDEGLLKEVTIFEFDDSFHLIERKDSPQARFDSGAWIFENLATRRFDPKSGMIIESHIFPEKKLQLAKKPEDFIETLYKTEQMGFFELRSLIEKLQGEGYDARRYKVDMHSRLAHPFACLTMAILGIPFALRKGRGASLSLGVTLSVAIGIIFYLLQATLMALGYASVIPPFAAAWSAVLLFTLIGLWLLLSTRN